MSVPIPSRKPPIPSPSGGFGSLGNFDPGGSIVGFLDPAENAEESIGQSVGAAAGSFIPVPVVGSAIGAFIGGKIGGLFGDDGDYPYVRSDVLILDEKAYTNRVTTLDGASASDGRSLGDAVADGINSIIDFIGGRVRFDVNPDDNPASRYFKLGYAQARGALDTGFFAGGRGDFGTGATYEGLQSADQAVEYSLTEFLTSAKFIDNPEADKIIKASLAKGNTAYDALNDLAAAENAQRAAEAAAQAEELESELQTQSFSPEVASGEDRELGLVTTQNSENFYNNEQKSLPLLLAAAIGFIITQ